MRSCPILPRHEHSDSECRLNICCHARFGLSCCWGLLYLLKPPECSQRLKRFLSATVFWPHGTCCIYTRLCLSLRAAPTCLAYRPLVELPNRTWNNFSKQITTQISFRVAWRNFLKTLHARLSAFCVDENKIHRLTTHTWEVGLNSGETCFCETLDAGPDLAGRGATVQCVTSLRPETRRIVSTLTPDTLATQRSCLLCPFLLIRTRSSENMIVADIRTCDKLNRLCEVVLSFRE